MYLYVGAIAFGGDVFPAMEEEDDPKLNHLNCTGHEDRIQDCSSNSATTEPCSTAVVLCQGNCMSARAHTVCTITQLWVFNNGLRTICTLNVGGSLDTYQQNES